MRAKSPGKIIICGEHSVLYGSGAIATAIDRYAYCELEKMNDLRKISITLCDEKFQTHLTVPQLEQKHREIENRYHAFQEGHLRVFEIILEPQELYLFGLYLFARKFEIDPGGWNLRIRSEIPMGSGMGSSAATITAMYKALLAAYEITLPQAELIEMVRQTEALQHGKSSGLDPAICVRGGAQYFFQGQSHVIDANLDSNWHWIFTGKPTSTTGECVAFVSSLKSSQQIWERFRLICERFLGAITRGKSEELHELIKANHSLLEELGVVPAPVAHFIARLQEHGISAKISGAGSITGMNAGVVIAYGNGELFDICRKFGYRAYRFHGDRDGLRATA